MKKWALFFAVFAKTITQTPQKTHCLCGLPLTVPRNTEGNNTEEKKKNISTVNLEKLKENSKDEISNDEDIQSENESLNEIENNSKDKLLDNENLNNENNIQSDEKDNSPGSK